MKFNFYLENYSEIQQFATHCKIALENPQVENLNGKMFSEIFSKMMRQSNSAFTNLTQREWLTGPLENHDPYIANKFLLWVKGGGDELFVDPFESIGEVERMDLINDALAPLFEIRCIGNFTNRNQLIERAYKIFDQVKDLEQRCNH